jgi:oligopeptide/dipeptide ABC transporter ATP-binding protein
MSDENPVPDAAPANGDVLLRVENLVKYFPARSAGLVARREYVHAVDGVSMTVRRGQTFGVVGETGCGKSTLARCIARLHDVTSGRIVFDGQDITRFSERRMRPLRREIQMIFQDPIGSLNPRRRVGSIIGDPFAIHGLASGAERTRRVQELMERVGLNPEHYNRFPAEFSGGQRQRIGVARALAFRPKLIICDEPVSALDASIQAQVINLLADLQAEFGLTYIFIAHDLSVVRHVSHTVAVMYLGQLVETAPVEEVFTRPRHPYTGALLSAVSVPGPDRSGEREQIVLVGDVPSPVAPPSGCRFHPRCPKAAPVCVAEAPPLEPHPGDGPEHPAACHLPLAVAEDLAEFPPTMSRLTIAEEQRVIDVGGSVPPDASVPGATGVTGMVGAARAAGSGPAMSTVRDSAGPATAAETALVAGERPAGKKIEGRSPWRLAYERLRSDRSAKIAAGTILVIVLLAIFAPVFAAITGHGPDQQFINIGENATGGPVPPSGTFWFGTDSNGRDLFVRVLYGARVSLLVGVLATAISVALGVVFGLAAGYIGGFVDSLIARVIDVMLSIPLLLIAISVAYISGPGIWLVIVIVGVLSFTYLARIVRGQVISLKEKEYIQAARALGAGPWRIMFTDLLPNVMAQVIVYASLLIPLAIVTEAALSFLGVGVPPPTPDWGQMINDASGYYQYGYWWYLLFPSLALLITTLAFNIFGDSVRDAFDPRGARLFV